MTAAMQEDIPDAVTWTKPEGGMFIWVTLPERVLIHGCFRCRTQGKVAVLPGIPFYVDGGGTNTLRLNFSNSSDGQIIDGDDSGSPA